MNHLQILDSTLAATGKVISGIDSAEWTAPTPCPEWTVRDLLNHVVGAVRCYALAVADKPIGEFNPLETAPELIGDVSPASAYDEAAADCAAAFKKRGDLEGRIQLWGAEPSPATFVWQIVVGDVLLHGWDLASATGQTYDIDDHTAEEVWRVFKGNLPEGVRGVAFGPEVEAPLGASPLDRLVAYSGRQPG